MTNKLHGFFHIVPYLVLWFLVTLASIYGLDAKVAWLGFSPLDWTYRFNHNIDISGAFDNGVISYRFSAPMYIYPLLERYLGIPAEITMYAFIALEIAFLMWAMYILSRSVIGDSPAVVFILIAIFTISSWLRDMNMARFVQPFFWGLYYSYADAFRLLAIAMIFRGSLLVSALLLAASFASHPALGLIGAMVAAGMALGEPSLRRRRSALLAALCYLVLTGLWFYRFSGTNMASGGIETEQWLLLTKALGWHWYPVQFGLFGQYYNERFLPFLSFLLLSHYYIPHDRVGNLLRRGMAVGLLLTVAGVLISWCLNSPFLIKLSLHRSNDLVILLGIPHIMLGLYKDIRFGKPYIRILAAGLLFSPFILHPGLPLLLTLPLLWERFHLAFGAWRKEDRDWLKICGWMMGAVLFLGYGLIFIDNEWTRNDFIRWTAIILSMGLLWVFGNYTHWQSRLFDKAVGVGIVTLSAAWLGYSSLSFPAMAEAKAYKEVQLWARDHTAKDALFMSDPTLLGWRDYSQRASVGSFFEWLHTGWLYDSKLDTYEEGLRRYAELSNGLNNGLHLPRPLDGFFILQNQARDGYYSASDDKLRSLARKYGIHYFVMQKKFINKNPGFTVVFENNDFLVFDAYL